MTLETNLTLSIVLTMCYTGKVSILQLLLPKPGKDATHPQQGGRGVRMKLISNQEITF